MHKLYTQDQAPTRLPGRPMENAGLGDTWIATTPIPCVGRAGSLALLNMLVREGRGTFIVNLPGVRGFRVQQFDFMQDREWIEIIVRDAILNMDIPITVPWYTNFGFNLQKEEWGQ